MIERGLRRRHCIVALAGVTALGISRAQTPTAARATVLVVGDSISAEYGLPRGSGWVALLAQRLATHRLGASVVNASISGDTTSGGRARLGALLTRHQPRVVVLELGGNDALRGLPLALTQDNLDAMTRAAQTAGARVLLAGMQVPPNYGAAYARGFADLYVQVARARGAALLPFLLAGIADDPDPLRWFQPDRIHPNAAAQARIAANIWPVLSKLL